MPDGHMSGRSTGRVSCKSTELKRWNKYYSYTYYCYYYSGRPDVGVGDVVDGVGADVDVEVSLAAQQGGCFAGGPACVRAEVHHRVKPTCTMHQHTAASTDRQ